MQETKKKRLVRKRDSNKKIPDYFDTPEDIAALAEALNNGGDPNTIIGDDEGTALMVAAERAEWFAVDLLLQHGADVHRRDATGKTTLNRMAADGFIQAEVMGEISFGNDYVVKIIDGLVTLGADINTYDNEGSTPLHYAARSESSEGVRLVRLLLDHGADVDMLDYKYRTPLIIAAGSQPPLRDSTLINPIFPLLLESGSDPTWVTDEGYTPLLTAVEHGNYQAVECLRAAHTPFGSTPSTAHLEPVLAAIEGDADRLLTALRDGQFDVNVRCLCGRTALMWASERGDTEIMRILLEHGADIEAHDNFGWTPLLFTILRARLSACELLIDHGADLNVTVSGLDLYNPLSLALKCNGNDNNHLYQSHRSIIKLLLDKNAPLDESTNIWRAASYASPELLRYLIARGARTTVANAAMAGALDILEELLKQGEDPEQLDTSRTNTGLCWAAQRGNVEAIEVLLRYGAKVDRPNGRETTALMYAAWYGHESVVRKLLSAGADRNRTDWHKETAADYADIRGHSHISQILRAKEAAP